jgi:hypothetical protein
VSDDEEREAAPSAGAPPDGAPPGNDPTARGERHPASFPGPDARLIGEYAEAERPQERRALLRRLTRRPWPQPGGPADAAPLAAGRPQSLDALTARVYALAGTVRVRSAEQLARENPHLTHDQVADKLIGNAARNAAAVGAATGMSAALPIPVTWPVELVTEALAVIGIEIKLIAELYEVYGVVVPGSRSERTMTYLTAWTRRGVVPVGSAEATLAAWALLRGRAKRRVALRAGRGAASLAPLLSGAVLGAVVNRRETRRLGQRIRRDLRKLSSGADSGWTR